MFARRLMKDCGDDTKGMAERAWMLAFARPITAQELTKSLEFLRRREEKLGARTEPLAELCLSLFNANEFVYPD